ncbi:MAG TPA: hypothetical protein GX707_15380 [Epulopiscium sp.]|nr:hypothetical protein [Candidatus Epulonipiscium sp.]
MIIKTIGMGCILISATILGWYVDRLKILRIEDLEGLRKILHMLHSEVSYSVTPLPMALKEIIEKNNTRINAIFKELLALIETKTGESISILWEKAIKSQRAFVYLEEDDVKNLLSFGQTLGYLDKEMQKKNIEITLRYIESQIKRLDKQQDKNGRLYRSLGMLGGCLLCILLF